MQTPQSYVIESIRNLDGTAHEREDSEKGQRVEILRCEKGAPMLVCYRDDGNKILRTSPIVSIGGTRKYPGGLVVTTKNTVYTFGKGAE